MESDSVAVYKQRVSRWLYLIGWEAAEGLMVADTNLSELCTTEGQNKLLVETVHKTSLRTCCMVAGTNLSRLCTTEGQNKLLAWRG
ncbi:hypothetical protein J6590_056031 [Homalodisca vitripennis]|nr:hypothetical protein J6590_056031 [Homalodisca vitripennis]